MTENRSDPMAQESPKSPVAADAFRWLAFFLAITTVVLFGWYIPYDRFPYKVGFVSFKTELSPLMRALLAVPDSVFYLVAIVLASIVLTMQWRMPNKRNLALFYLLVALFCFASLATYH